MRRLLPMGSHGMTPPHHVRVCVAFLVELTELAGRESRLELQCLR